MDVHGQEIAVELLPMWLEPAERDQARAAMAEGGPLARWHAAQALLLELQAAYAEHPRLQEVCFELRGPMSERKNQWIGARLSDAGARVYPNRDDSREEQERGAEQRWRLEGLIDRDWPGAGLGRLLTGKAVSTRERPVEDVGRALMSDAGFEYWIGSQLSARTKRELEASTPTPAAERPAPRI